MPLQHVARQHEIRMLHLQNMLNSPNEKDIFLNQSYVVIGKSRFTAASTQKFILLH